VLQVIAGIFSVLNYNRQLVGKPPLGFLNQIIYQAPKGVFNDIVGGSNPGCFNAGFEALSGWDPVTGVGSPNIPALTTYLQGLP
jgi:tripeptidyl-peptidase-1